MITKEGIDDLKKKMKKRIVIDTNIWYNISNEEIIKLTEDYTIIVPLIIMNEIYTSPNLSWSKDRFDSTQKAINTILKNIDNIEFIELNPFEFMFNDIYSEIKPSNNTEFYLEEFKALLQLDFEIIKRHHKNRYDISDLTNFINSKSVIYREEIRSDNDKFERFDSLKTTKALILNYANDNLELVNKFYPKMTELDMNKFELLVLCFDSLLREISKSQQKIKNNDWVDIFLLTFVGEGDLYWTREKSKLKLIVNIGLEKYLFRDIKND